MHKIFYSLLAITTLSFGAELLPVGVSWKSKNNGEEYVEIGLTNQCIHRFWITSGRTNYFGYYKASHITNVVSEIGIDRLIQEKYSLSHPMPLTRREIFSYMDILRFYEESSYSHPHYDWIRLGDWNDLGDWSRERNFHSTADWMEKTSPYRIKTTIKPQTGTTNATNKTP